MIQEEVNHMVSLLKQTQIAILEKDALKLKDLSNNTLHSATSQQDSASITIAVIVYTLSKLIEREDYQRIKKWAVFVKKFNSSLNLAIKALKENNLEKYEEYIESSRRIITSQSINIKPYIQDVIKKAAINKGSRIYEHGISLEQTAKLLGITQWELSDYIGQKSVADVNADTFDVKKRAKMVLEFFK